MKKFASVLLIVLLVLGMAACGGESPYDAGSPASVAAPAQPGDYAPTTDTEAGSGAYVPPVTEVSPEDGSWRYAPRDEQEAYDDSKESPFKDIATSPLSTFSSDVDTASYSNMRRFIQNGQKPQGVRIEELVNYFDYSYERPGEDSDHPFAVHSEVAPCPWNEDHLLAMIGVQGEELQNSNDISNNIVFLLDVSGSMESPNKLPLLRESFKLLLGKLDKNDVISIVTYAGGDKIVADSVPGTKRAKLQKMMDTLSAGGSTAGAQGLRTAYQLAEKNFIDGGNNRIILATDGDFNVGESTTQAMTDLIEKEREKDIYISVLGFGMGNLKDNMMETIADCGNGNYAYIDNLAEAKKVLVDEFDSTMFVIAQDLKLQVEFNGAVVSQYRLLGYNNRRLENEDFNDEKKDAGDVGAGHSVTAFYELIPVGSEGAADVDGLKYQSVRQNSNNEFMTVKIRYKTPGQEESTLSEYPVGEASYTETPSQDFGFASAVAEFGLILTDSDYRGISSISSVLQRAEDCRGSDDHGFRREFAELVDIYADIAA